MSEPFLGEIRMVGFNFAPRGWASCNGQLMAISANSALFALLGTTFGGDGRVTFGLPDLRGRVPVGIGSGGAFPQVVQGEMAGTQQVTLSQVQMPVHTHLAVPSLTLGAATVDASSPSPDANSFLAKSIDAAGTGADPAIYAPASPSGAPPATVPLAGLGGSINVSPAGGSQPVDVRNPYLGTNYIIALEGIFPSRP